MASVRYRNWWRGVWTARSAATIGMVVAVLAAACGHNPASVTSPSGSAPAGLNSGPGTPVRDYVASISPTATSPGTHTFTVTITNCDSSITACQGNSSTVSNGVTIKSAGITVPSGFTGVTNVHITSTPAGKSWSAFLVSGSINLGANSGNDGLAPAESVSVEFDATVADCGTYPWNTAAYQDTLNSDHTLNTATSYTLIGNQPSVSVTGCGTGDCPAAPAIAAAYLHDHGVASNDPLFNSIVNAVALKMAAGDFGRDPCAEGYSAEVIAYILTLL